MADMRLKLPFLPDAVHATIAARTKLPNNAHSQAGAPSGTARLRLEKQDTHVR